MKKALLYLVLLALHMSRGALAEENNGIKNPDNTPALGSLDDGLLETDHFPPRPARPASKSEAAALRVPLADTFRLHSYPSSNQKLYIDFDGFKGVWGDYTAWTLDGDADTFNDAERSVIQQVWQSVSEDFLPFNIDVTTEEPPPGWVGQRAVVDGSHEYDYSWAYHGDWARTADREAYIFPGDDTWLWIADSISHEVGHTLNLSHDGNPTDGEYYEGHGTGDTQWCPIMGWGAWSLNQWDDGEYSGTTNPDQDDLATIVAVRGVNFRPDDHGSTPSTATAVTLPDVLSFVAEGIIGRRTDVDYFAFTTAGGNVQFSINEDVMIGASNLDILAKIHDASGAVLYTSNPVDKIYASFDVNLAAGDYYLSIDGTGLNDPFGPPHDGYSVYGSLGYYRIEARCTTEIKRGDSNSDGLLDLSDAISILTFLFKGGPALPCPEAADANTDDTLDLSDPIFIILFLFGGGSPPTPVFVHCTG